MKCISKIGDLRKQAGLTQRELAIAVGVTETTIANWERGRSGLDWIIKLLKLCQELNCSLEDLVIYEDENIKPDEADRTPSEVTEESEEEPSFEQLRQLYRAGLLGTKIK